MPSQSEKTFGQRLEKGYQLLANIKNLGTGYHGAGDTTISAFEQMLEAIKETNDTASTSEQTLSQTRAARTEAFHGENGLKVHIAKIRDFIATLPEGKESVIYRNVQKLSQKAIGYRKPSAKAETEVGATEPEKKRISQFETSFGSLIDTGRQVATLIESMGAAYAPANPALSLAAFKTFLSDLEAKNQAVADRLAKAQTATHLRREIYESPAGLRERMQKIKAQIAADYGRQSAEYKTAAAIQY